MIRLLVSVFALAFILSIHAGAAESASSNATADITTWQVPWDASRPRDPAVAPDDSIWFVGQRGNYLARLNPGSGEFTQFDLPEGTAPHNCVVDAQGNVWYAGNRSRDIGRLNPETREIRRYPMADERLRDPHTLIFGPDGNLWFNAQQGNGVGKLNISTGEVEVIPVPTENARPYSVVFDDSGTLWVALFGTNKLARVDTSTMQLEEIDLPRAEARPRRIAATSDGRIWYGDFAGGKLGVYDPSTSEIREWDNPSGEDSHPYALTADDNDRIWFVESGPQPNKLVGFDSKSEEFVSVTEVPDSGGYARYMVADDGALWFGLDSNYMARARLPEPAPAEIEVGS